VAVVHLGTRSIMMRKPASLSSVQAMAALIIPQSAVQRAVTSSICLR
jgi:hypothetical protein